MTSEELEEHRFWYRAAREGLIDSVGGMEWKRRHAGTPIGDGIWLSRHERLEKQWEAEEAQAKVLATATRAGYCPVWGGGEETAKRHVSTRPPLVLGLWEIFGCDNCGGLFTKDPSGN